MEELNTVFEIQIDRACRLVHSVSKSEWREEVEQLKRKKVEERKWKLNEIDQLEKALQEAQDALKEAEAGTGAAGEASKPEGADEIPIARITCNFGDIESVKAGITKNGGLQCVTRSPHRQR